MSAVDEIPREQPGTAANLQHQTAARSDRFEQFQDPRRDRVGMEPEAQVVDEGEVLPVVGRGAYGRGRPAKGASGVPRASWIADE